jgi:hypothetical protein
MATKGSVDEVLVPHMASGRLRPVMDATFIYMRLLCFTREGQLRSLAPQVRLGGAPALAACLPSQPALQAHLLAGRTSGGAKAQRPAPLVARLAAAGLSCRCWPVLPLLAQALRCGLGHKACAWGRRRSR